MGELLGIESSVVKFVIAFVLVMALIGLTAWLIRQFGSARPSSGSGARNRQPRLAVLDSAVVDARRRLVLIRRDNVEHLLMIGGPTDVVVEANVVRAQSPGGPVLVTPAAQRMQQRAPIEPIEPDYDPSLVPMDEPFYEEPAPQRPAPRAAPTVRAPAPPPPPSSSPRVSAPVPPRTAPAAAPARVQPQFSDMAQRMEAALRAPAPDVPPVRPMAEPRVPAPAAPPRTEPQLSAPAPAAEPQAGDVFANLEEEMANLLKPGGKNPA
jgi:flagellar protein FliO/FliZ